MFRFPSPCLLCWWVGRSGKKRQQQQKEWTLEGVWVPDDAGLLSTKAWLQSQLENVVFWQVIHGSLHIDSLIY